jgi:UPF0755 protein
MKRLLLVGGVLLALVAVAAVGLGLAVRQALEPAAPAAAEVVFRVERGDSVARVASRLESEGLVRDARAVRGLARWYELGGSLQVGEFAISAAMTPREILDKLASGRVVTYEVVIPEGFTQVMIAERLAQAGLVDPEAFLELAGDPSTAQTLGVEGQTLEGYLYPDTYRLAKGLSPLAVAGTLVGQFLAVWQELEPIASAQGKNMREVVTLASIVEKETGVPEERPLIAGVFLNRMKKGMRLETDPTVIYGIENFDGNLRRRHLEDASNVYNTYKIKGLPPGPIASPGHDALQAVLEPADTAYLFFVSRNDGTHVFSETYREHVNAVNRYQRRHSSR